MNTNNLISNRKSNIITLSVAFCLIMVYIEQSGIILIIEQLKQVFNLSETYSYWIINSYILSLAVFILFSGKLGDIFGHKKIFLWGLIFF